MRCPLRGAAAAGRQQACTGRRLCLVEAPISTLWRRSTEARQLEQDPSARSQAENQLAGRSDADIVVGVHAAHGGVWVEEQVDSGRWTWNAATAAAAAVAAAVWW
jgi:hypothetical protein